MIHSTTDIRSAPRARQRGFLLNPFRFGGGMSYPAVANILSIDFDGADGSTSFTDDSPYARTLTANSAAAIDTSVFPGGALELISQSYVSATVGAEMSFAGDFTWEVRASNWQHGTGGGAWVLAGASNSPFFGCNSAGRVEFGRANIAYDLTSATGLVTTGAVGTLTTIKAQRVGTTLKLYVNNVEVASQTNSTTYTFATPIRIGNYNGSNVFTFVGQIAWVRMSSP